MKIDDLLSGLSPGKTMTMRELAAYFQVTNAAVYQWKEGAIPPLRQLQVEAATGGRLRAGPECDNYRLAHDPEPKAAA